MARRPIHKTNTGGKKDEGLNGRCGSTWLWRTVFEAKPRSRLPPPYFSSPYRNPNHPLYATLDISSGMWYLTFLLTPGAYLFYCPHIPIDSRAPGLTKLFYTVSLSNRMIVRL